jgi:hypothetical protein
LNSKNRQIEHHNIQITIEPLSCSQIEPLKKQWLTLEVDANPAFFLSWKWIGTWLKQIKSTEKIILVKAQHQNRIVGLGIFVEQKTTRYKILNCTQWFLHRCGNEDDDQIWIENNDFLTTVENKEAVTQAIWCKIFSQHSYVDEFLIAIHHSKPELFDLPTQQQYSSIPLYVEKGYYLSLKNIVTIDEYLATLSKNTRKQIKRSNKLLHHQGEFHFSVAQLAKQQKQLLEQSKQWHIDKWQQTDTPSGFINPKFTEFHRNLITHQHESAKTLVASLRIDKELYGCLYCFIGDNCAYFYLSALKPITDNRVKLGLTLHELFIQWLIENEPNVIKYDFLAGEARYKKSLASHQDDHCYLLIQKNSIKFKIEKGLKLIKNKLITYFFRNTV